MKPNELRIGNWVKRDTQPDGFQIDKMSFMRVGKKHHDYQPIPLTPEWLERMGFKLESKVFMNYYSLEINGFTIEFEFIKEKIDGSYLELIGFDIKYVHQLQNLYFALTGEELEIKEKS